MPRRTARSSFAIATGILATVAACVPTFDDDLAIVRAPRVVAVRSVPAEAAPGQPVTLEALVVAPLGETPAPDALSWAFCLARKPLTELGPVAQACVDRFGEASDIFSALGDGLQVAATVPPDACRSFGPLVPPADKSGVSARPVDPDATGGYRQPIVLGRPDLVTLGAVRIACGAVGIPNAEVVRFNQGYRPNENPEVAKAEIETAAGERRALEPERSGGAGAPRVSVRAGERVSLHVAWATCPDVPACGDGLCTAGENATTCAADCRDAPKGCTGAERYLYADTPSQRTVERRESLSVAWYATGGAFAEEVTSRGSSDPTPETTNGWTAPSSAGPVAIWTVLRDERGGVGFQKYVIDVTP